MVNNISNNNNFSDDNKRLDNNIIFEFLRGSLLSQPRVTSTPEMNQNSNNRTGSLTRTRTNSRIFDIGVNLQNQAAAEDNTGDRVASSSGLIARRSLGNGLGSGTGNNSTPNVRKNLYDLNRDNIIDDNETAYSLLLARANNNNQVYRDLLVFNRNTRDIQITIAAMDFQKDGRISDSELIQTILRRKNGSLNLNENFFNLVSQNNLNKNQIINLIQAIDTDNSGKINNIEVLDTILASKSGLLNIENPLIRSILSTNPKFANLIALSPSYDSNFNENITDRDVYEIILALKRGNVPGDLANKTLRLGNNENALEIEKSIDFFDVNNDGIISSAEFVTGVINSRRNNNQQSSQDENSAQSATVQQHEKFLQVVNDIPDLKNLLDAINFIDKNQDAVFSNQEVVEMSFAVARGLVSFSESTLNTILVSNNRNRDIRSLFDRVDIDDNGNISNQEVFDSLIDLKKRRINPNQGDILGMILAENSNSQNILNAIQAVDTDNNGVISGIESIIAQIKSRKGELPNLANETLNIVFDASPDKEKVSQVLNYLDPDSNGLVDDIDLFTKALRFEAGNSGMDKVQTRDIFTRAIVEFDEDSNVRNALLGFDQSADGVVDARDFARGLVKKERGEIYLSPQLFNHIKSLNPNYQIIENAFNILDPNNDNQVSAQEFIGNFNQVISVNGQANFERLSVMSDVIDIFYPNAASLKAFRDAIDTDRNNQLTNQELISGLLKIKQGVITNPGADIINAITSTNPDAQKIISLIGQIDLDNDGIISNLELTNNFLKIRNNEFEAQDLGFVQAILNTNDRYDDIQNLVNLFDRNQDGDIGDLELFDALIKLKSGTYSGFTDNAVVNLLKSKNPNATAFETVLREFDSNNDGKSSINEMISGFLKVISGQITEPNSDIINSFVDTNGTVYSPSRISEIRNFVTVVNKDSNDQISDLELIDMILTQRNPSDNITFDTELYNAIIANNPNSANINAFLNSIDPDNNGTISDSEFENLITQRKEGMLNNFNSEWVNHILAKSNSYTSLMALIDVDNNGSIGDAELVSSIRRNKMGELANYSPAMVNEILSHNSRLTHFQAIYDFVDPNGNGVIADSEVVNSLLKYFDNNLEPSFRSSDNLNDADLAIVESLLSTNPNYQTIRTQLNSLISVCQGDLHEMNNKLQDIRSGAVIDTSYAQLIPAMEARLNQWMIDRVNLYEQKFNNLKTAITEDSAIVSVGATSNEKQLFNSFNTQQTEINKQNKLIQEQTTAIEELRRLLRDYPRTRVRQRQNNMRHSEQVVATARIALDNATQSMNTARESAYTALGISASTRSLMNNVLDKAELVRVARSTNNSSYYSKMDDLLNSYAQLTQVLPPNKENLLSVLFFDQLGIR